jgi:eukaryotic-like serine/threonine-protein kinase
VPCVDDNTVVELMARRLAPERRAAVYAHLDACDMCRALVAGAADELVDSSSSSGGSDDLTALLSPPPSAPAQVLPLVLPPGAMVDHYRVVRLLGRGGMGEVYLALDTLLERKVALKMVKPELRGREEAIDRFLAEARATARLNHTNIVTLHAVGTHEGRPYLALELLTGETLRARLERGALDWETAARVALAVARALAAAHAAGVCHRDLKPSNVMLCLDGRICVLDFGLAKVLDALEVTWIDGDEPSGGGGDGLERTSTRTGGTPPYMAPEQWRGEPTTGAADVWALGVLLFEACAGRRPFEANREAARAARLAELAALIGAREAAPALATAVPDALSALVGRCLEKDPERRPLADEVVRSLVEIVAPAPAWSVPARSPRPARGRLAFGVAVAAFALVSGGALASRVARPLPDAGVQAALRTDAAPERARAPAAPAAPPAASPEASTPEPVKPPRVSSSAAPPQAKSAEPWDPTSYR